MSQLTPRQFENAEGTDDWRVLADGAHAFFAAGSLADGARLARAIGALVGSGPGRPDVDLRADGVTVRLVTATDDSYGMTTDDAELAARISAGPTALPAGQFTLTSNYHQFDGLVSSLVSTLGTAEIGRAHV